MQRSRIIWSCRGSTVCKSCHNISEQRTSVGKAEPRAYRFIFDVAIIEISLKYSCAQIIFSSKRGGTAAPLGDWAEWLKWADWVDATTQTQVPVTSSFKAFQHVEKRENTFFRSVATCGTKNHVSFLDVTDWPRLWKWKRTFFCHTGR